MHNIKTTTKDTNTNYRSVNKYSLNMQFTQKAVAFTPNYAKTPPKCFHLINIWVNRSITVTVIGIH